MSSVRAALQQGLVPLQKGGNDPALSLRRFIEQAGERIRALTHPFEQTWPSNAGGLLGELHELGPVEDHFLIDLIGVHFPIRATLGVRGQ